MVVHSSEIGYRSDDIDMILVKVSEVLEGGDSVPAYDYVLSSHAQMTSFLVADTYLTQYYINYLIVDFLHEALFMGSEQEHLNSFIEELEKSRKDAEEGRCIPFDEAMRELEEKYVFEREKRDSAQEEVEDELMTHKMRYDRSCREIEISKIRDILRKEL